MGQFDAQGGLFDKIQEAVSSSLEQTLQRFFDHYLGPRFRDISAQLTRMENSMAVDFSKLQADLTTLAQGYVAQQAIIKAQADALANADQATQDAVASAIESNDAADQSAVDAADQIAVDALNPPADTPPADGGGGDLPPGE